MFFPPKKRIFQLVHKYFYPSIELPFAEKGYKVITREQSKEIIEAGSNLNSKHLLETSLSDLGNKHGVDMVVFTLIHEWEHD